MANLIVDIGNTALKAAWTDGISLGKIFRYQGEKNIDFLISLTRRVKPEIMVVCSSRSLSQKNIDRLFKECEKLVILDPANTSFLSKNDLPAYLSPDRAASIIASRFLFKGKGCVIFDFGTTLTIDFLDIDGKYLGGNISPGCTTRFKSLNRYSKSLPLIDTPEEIEEYGKNLKSSISSGVISSIIFEIEGYIGRNPENVIIFTGGDAIYFGKRMKNSIFVVCNLVLMGLALIAQDYAKID